MSVYMMLEGCGRGGTADYGVGLALLNFILIGLNNMWTLAGGSGLE